jgi:antitoxin Phd
MNIDTNTIASMTEANQNFSRVAKVAETKGQAVIFKNNRPKFLLIDVEKNGYFDLTEEERIDVAAARVLKRFKGAFEELAK